MLAFFEFTTGAPHPLSTTHTISLPLILPVRKPSIEIEVLGNHILVSVQYCLNRRCVFLYLVSWKTGVVTHVSDAINALRHILNPLSNPPSFAYVEIRLH